MTANMSQRGEVRSVSMTRAAPDVDEPGVDISPSGGLDEVGVAGGIFLPHLTRLTVSPKSSRYRPFFRWM